MINYSLLQQGNCYAVALSGGADSMFLAYQLLNCKEKFNITIKAINVEHGIRGEESLNDSKFVKEFCTKHNIELASYSVDVLSHSKEYKLSIEESARMLRYNCFYNAIKNGFCQKVVTAHHADDNTESILLNIFRGCSIAGLKGIEPISQDGQIVRPMLNCNKQQIEEYIKKHNIEYVVDSTNFSNDYSRNYLRNEIMPLIASKFNGYQNCIARLSQLASQDEMYLQNKARQLVIETDNDIKVLRSDDISVFSRAVLLAFKKAGIKKDYQKCHIDDCFNLQYKTTSSSISLPNNKIAINQYDNLLITNAKLKQTENLSIPYTLGEIQYNNFSLNIFKIDNNLNEIYFDGDKIPAGACIRSRQAKDVFTKCNGSTKTLKAYYIEKKIDSSKRNSLPIIAIDNKVLVIFGVAVSDTVKVEPTSKNIVACKIKKIKSKEE